MPVLHTVDIMLLSVVGVECGGIVRTGSRCTSRDAGVWGRQMAPQRRHREPSLRRRQIQLAFHTRLSRSLRCVHLQQLIKASINLFDLSNTLRLQEQTCANQVANVREIIYRKSRSTPRRTKQ